ncbi:MAG: regulatory iron-sulfur-containing complex subunit RicT [candidate division Zixibacteria bacterium]
MADLFLIEFKGHRKEYFLNKYYHDINRDDNVIIQAERGEDAGIVKQQLDSEVKIKTSSRPRSILRPASEEDIARIKEILEQEARYKEEVIGIIRRHGLVMKVVDVELQFDGNKMTVFFTADQRVDFRALVKELASEYKTRIEMRQIGVRDEARRVGGYGICGKEQCCSSFLTEFTPISTQDARLQDLPLNPSKLSGNCGRLLCCLKYEVDIYKQTKRKFPQPGKFVSTVKGDGFLERVDYFREEAIIKNSEGEAFRVSADEINKSEDREVSTESSIPVPVVSVFDESKQIEPASEEELKKLDEPDEE